MKFNGKPDVVSHIRSMCGTNYQEEDNADEVLFRIPTKASVQAVEVARRNANAEAKRLGHDVEVDLPDYVFEDKYKAVMLSDGYWRVLIKRGSEWIEMHGGQKDRSNYIDIMKSGG